MTAMWADQPDRGKRQPLSNDDEEYVRRYVERSRMRDQLEPECRYRQTTEDESWLNQLGITGTNKPPQSGS